jgi:hypothetical protein
MHRRVAEPAGGLVAEVPPSRRACDDLKDPTSEATESSAARPSILRTPTQGELVEAGKMAPAPGVEDLASGPTAGDIAVPPAHGSGSAQLEVPLRETLLLTRRPR